MIRFTCECGITTRKLFRAGKEITGSLPCECGKEMKRILSGPAGVDTKIRVDNGVQARGIDISIDQIKDGENRARFAQKMREKP
jgi:hypothetical protein